MAVGDIVTLPGKLTSGVGRSSTHKSQGNRNIICCMPEKGLKAFPNPASALNSLYDVICRLDERESLFDSDTSLLSVWEDMG
jgi:hypothetical protein